MDKAHLCLRRTKTNKNEKNKKTKRNEESKNLALMGLAVQVEYLSNLYS